jgi:argininosuccinate lyase
MHNTPFTDMNDCETEVQGAGYAAFAAAERLLPLLGSFMRAVKVDGAKVRKHIDESCIAITEFADSLVRTEAISFRQAHEVAAHVARRAIDSGRALSALPYQEIGAIFAEAIGRPLRVPEPELRGFTTPEHFVVVCASASADRASRRCRRASRATRRRSRHNAGCRGRGSARRGGRARPSTPR